MEKIKRRSWSHSQSTICKHQFGGTLSGWLFLYLIIFDKIQNFYSAHFLRIIKNSNSKVLFNHNSSKMQLLQEKCRQRPPCVKGFFRGKDMEKLNVIDMCMYVGGMFMVLYRQMVTVWSCITCILTAFQINKQLLC